MWDGVGADGRIIQRGAAWKTIGLQLAGSFAMNPAASASGSCFSHPQARYVAVGKIGKDQVQRYGRRTGMEIKGAKRWLKPNLGY